MSLFLLLNLLFLPIRTHTNIRQDQAPRCSLFSFNPFLPYESLDWFQVFLKKCLCTFHEDVLVLNAEGSLYFKSSSLSTVISVSEKPGFHNQLWLLELVKVLKPGGFVFLQEPTLFVRGSKDFVSFMHLNVFFFNCCPLSCVHGIGLDWDISFLGCWWVKSLFRTQPFICGVLFNGGFWMHRSHWWNWIFKSRVWTYCGNHPIHSANLT